MEGKIVYFENPGGENTDDTLRIARERARELGIKTVVVASTSGETAAKSVEVFEGMKVIAVSLVAGARAPNTQVFIEENRQKVVSRGGTVLTTAHVFTGIEGAMRRRFDMHLFGEIIACTLRVFGHGTKVACEVALMAADAGLVRTASLLQTNVQTPQPSQERGSMVYIFC